MIVFQLLRRLCELAETSSFLAEQVYEKAIKVNSFLRWRTSGRKREDDTDIPPRMATISGQTYEHLSFKMIQQRTWSKKRRDLPVRSLGKHLLVGLHPSTGGFYCGSRRWKIPPVWLRTPSTSFPYQWTFALTAKTGLVYWRDTHTAHQRTSGQGSLVALSS